MLPNLRNHRVFLLAGGESINDVDISLLQGEAVITINKSFLVYPNAIINYAQDYLFYTNLTNNFYGEETTNKWKSFKGIKVFLKPFSEQIFDENIVLIPREIKQVINLDISKGIYGGTNSGLGAILLAVALGAKEIYLLGYDFSVKNKTHHHGGYGQNIEDFRKELVIYLKEIYKIITLLPEDIRIINLNPDSALRCFPFKSLLEVLKGE
jgi:hypothetical protein